MNMTKTYQPLSEIPDVKIGTCSAVLTNHMQCWRAGDVQVTQVEQVEQVEVSGIKTLATDKPELIQKAQSKTVEKTTYYQLCRAHALQDQQEYRAAQPPEAAPTPKK